MLPSKSKKWGCNMIEAKDIQKVKSLRRMDMRTLEMVTQELEAVSDISNTSRDTHRPHTVTMPQGRFVALDAKILNRYASQRGRGCWRYLADSSGSIVALARETDGRTNGSRYRIEAYNA
jgi:hypothetical protein